MENFSVLISVYKNDCTSQVKSALDSLLNQSLPPQEIILVEDGELNPELQTLIDKYHHNKNFNIIRLNKNVGLGKALNKGLQHCTHDLVARMDADDICKPNRFSKQIEFMQTHPEIDICSCWIDEFVGEISNIVSTRKVPATHDEIADFIKSRNPLNHPAVMFRKSAVERAGGYRHFPLFEDWYLWARMMVNGCKFANIQESLLYFRTSPDMFRRRGGWRYAIDSAKFQWTLHKLGLTTVFQAIKASILRGGVYVMPNKIRELIYKNILR